MSLFEQFSKDPIAYLDASFNGADPVAISPDQVCVGDPLTARRVLLHAEDLYDDAAEGTGFFSDQRFGRRSQQLELRTQARTIFRRHMDCNTGSALANAVAAEALTSILIGINRRYKVDGAGIRITGALAVSVD